MCHEYVSCRSKLAKPHCHLPCSELGLTRHDICWLTTAAADSRWWWVPHDRAPPQPLKGPLPQACAQEIAGALAER